MKKIILLSVLLLAGLLSLFSCSKESEYVPEYGTFYVSDDILQNTLVTLSVENETLLSPVTTLSYEVQNESAFDVHTDGKCLLEIYLNGEWQEAPDAMPENAIVIERPVLPQKIFSGSKEDYVAHFAMEGTSHVAGTYALLNEGAYRVRVQYSVFMDAPNVEIPQGQLEAVAYFTVVAPTE